MNYKVVSLPTTDNLCFGQSVVWLFSDALSASNIQDIQKYHENTYANPYILYLQEDIYKICNITSEICTEKFSITEFKNMLLELTKNNTSNRYMPWLSNEDGSKCHACAIKYIHPNWVLYDPETNSTIQIPKEIDRIDISELIKNGAHYFSVISWTTTAASKLEYVH